MRPQDTTSSAGGDPHRRFFEGLATEEKMLLTLRDELYGGVWDRMLEDLRDRLSGKPYIFKLVNKIEEDIARIEKLKRYEETHQVNLARYISHEGGA